MQARKRAEPNAFLVLTSGAVAPEAQRHRMQHEVERCSARCYRDEQTGVPSETGGHEEGNAPRRTHSGQGKHPQSQPNVGIMKGAQADVSNYQSQQSDVRQQDAWRVTGRVFRIARFRGVLAVCPIGGVRTTTAGPA